MPPVDVVMPRCLGVVLVEHMPGIAHLVDAVGVVDPPEVRAHVQGGEETVGEVIELCHDCLLCCGGWGRRGGQRGTAVSLIVEEGTVGYPAGVTAPVGCGVEPMLVGSRR